MRPQRNNRDRKRSQQPEPQQRRDEDGDEGAQGDDEQKRHFLQERLWLLCKLLIRLLNGEKPPGIAPFPAPDPYYQFPPDVKTPGGRTENFVLQGWVGAYVWFGLWGSPEQAQLWHRRVVDYFERMRAVGHMGGEQLCPDPHHGQHMNAVGVARLAAHYFGHVDVLELTGQWYADHLVIGEACADETGEVRAPCLRAKGRPPRQLLWSWFVREMRGDRHRPDLALKDDPFFVGAIAVRALRNRRDNLAPDLDEARAHCRLKYPLTVQQTRAGYLACMETPPGEKLHQPVHWVMVDGDDVRYGYEASEEPPAPPGEVVKVIRFGRGSELGGARAAKGAA